MSVNENSAQPVMRMPYLMWALILVAGAVLVTMLYDGLSFMVSWWDRDEYSHGYMIPAITLFLIWQKKDSLELIDFTGAWAGLLLVALGVFAFFLGELGTVYTIIQYAFLLSIWGFALALMGWQAFKKILVPLLILLFMIPLPTFIYNNLSAELQLISSKIGVAFIRLFDISVYLEGNVIDLGTYKLQVVEACSGLRYLFPLMTLGFIAAYFYKTAFWKRALIFLSSIPITVFMNSFRIGAIGVMVEYWGEEMAEGFLHDFEGWVVFMASLGVMIIEMWILTRIGRENRPLREVFGLEFPEPSPENSQIVKRPIPVPFVVSIILLLIAFAASLKIETREEIIPERTDFSEFPLHIGDWTGRRDQMEQIFIDQLKFDDYIMVDYSDGKGSPINFYVAYYGSQSKGQSAHSPRACLPGGGWQIKDHSIKTIEGVEVNGAPLSVNRFEIRKGDVAQLVYYWFQEQGRIVTNEYMVKWFLFWDALTKQRTDGALIRLTVYVPPGEDFDEAEERLTAFVGEVSGRLGRFIPD